MLSLDGIIVIALLELGHRIRERRKPSDGEASKYRLNAFPPRLLAPTRLLLLQLLYPCLVIPNGGQLGAQHDHREYRKEETLEHERHQQDHRGWRGIRGTSVPSVSYTVGKLIDGQENGMH